ncbi:succinyl-diaminopimelate desuccinylase [Nitratifractor salsuginis]|uniref:Succinyl-diaminopimelate desuccinylase n=1 Tax=Nitratifractor salsuginis (strain DSM 16511 / JCM 12458 / E9I37-1) TaxID=749222 RepID=E6X0W5_NITSE|nr:succinyl-diaminopimelate desuccinylase [Nitratifractor salsuginis]ADV46897.1 succinyl-diaminopimelate desuccinylase [Nitratifractor salsuginis DSM 16511]
MEVTDLLIRLLSAPSVTPDDAGLMEFVQEYLPGYEIIRLDEGGVKNLFMYRKFGEGEHLCFAGHVDVVPPGEGWRSDPFTPRIEKGVITARGAQDMKSGVAAFVEAMKRAERFNGTLSLLLTSDEEGDATYGTRIMLAHLRQIGLLPDYAIVAEPTCEERFGDAIKIGRRGSINGVIEKRGRQGHAAYPEKAVNPIHKVSQVLPHMAGVNLDEGDEFFAPSQFVITDIRAGMEVTNVTPGKLKMMFNVRNNTHTDLKDVEEFVHRYFSGMDYDLKLSQSAKPFVTDPDTRVVRVLDRAIAEVTGLAPKHSTAGGTSDARFFAEYGVKVVEFGVRNDTIHAPNERVPIDEVEGLYRVFRRVIEAF